MTLVQFQEMFAKLAIQLRQTDGDEATIRSYYKALSDLEPEFVAMAAERLSKTAEWFPKTSEWCAMAKQIERERQDQLKATLRNRSAPLCTACDDTGWRGKGESQVTPCECRELRRLEVLGRRPMPALPSGDAA